jgi:ABC-type glycerol-3-phosphate transport system substrate-binding protein
VYGSVAVKQRASIAILAVFLLVGGILVFLKTRSDASRPDGQGVSSSSAAGSASVTPPTGPKVALPFLYSTEKEEWLKDAVAQFVKDNPNIDVQMEGMGSLDAIRALLAGEKKPVLWSPADSLAVALLTTQWQLAKGASPLVKDGTKWPRPLVLTPLVFVAWESRAKVILGKDTDLSWQKLRDAVSSKKGWAGLGGDPGWGYVKFGHTDPSKSNSGLQALVLMAYGFYDRLGSLTVPDVTAQPFQDFVKALEAGHRANDFAAYSTGPFVQNLIRQGPSLYDVAVVYEALAITDVPRAAGRWEGLRVFYPNINLWNDHPACLFATDWVSDDQKKAAQTLVDYLMSPAVQKRALGLGYRPGNLDVPVITSEADNPFNKYKDIGIRVDVPRVAEAPDGAVLQSLLQTYQRNVQQ